MDQDGLPGATEALRAERLLGALAAIEVALMLSDGLNLHDTGCALDKARLTVEAHLGRSAQPGEGTTWSN